MIKRHTGGLVENEAGHTNCLFLLHNVDRCLQGQRQSFLFAQAGQRNIDRRESETDVLRKYFFLFFFNYRDAGGGGPNHDSLWPCRRSLLSGRNVNSLAFINTRDLRNSDSFNAQNRFGFRSRRYSRAWL